MKLRLAREFLARLALSVACVVSLGAFLACPPTPPAPVGPPSPDAAPAPVPCSTACAHAESVCPGAGSPCLPVCNRIAGAFPGCVMAASGCSSLNACDPLNAPPGAAKPRGK